MPRAEQYWRMTPAQREAKLERQRQYRISRPAVNGMIRSLFDSVDEYYRVYDELMIKQGGVCGICSKLPGQRRLHMDHDHETLEIRGLLCFSCNTKLGFVEKFKSQIERYMTW